MIKAVIFDLDDTLYDEVDYCRSGFLACSRFLAASFPSHGQERFFEELWGQFEAGNRRQTFDAALERLGLEFDDGLVADLVEVYRGHEPDIELPDQSRCVLETLGRDRQLALLTDGYMPGQRLKVKALGLGKYFRHIVYTEELGRQFWKPSPAGFTKLVDLLGTEPGQTAVVADNEKKDFITPNRLGMFTVQIIRPARLHTAPPPGPEGSASVVIHNIEELPRLLAGH
jgi:putative hydrolase of the HAD superfamily